MNAASPTRARVILGLSMLLPGIIYAMLVMSFAFWVAPWKSEFHLSQGTIMIAYTTGALVMTSCVAVTGRLLDWISVRTAVGCGALLMAVGLGLVSMATAFWQVLLLYATILPAATALGGMLPAQTILVRLFPRNIGLVSGCVTMSLALGGVIFSVVIPALLTVVDWRGVFLIEAGFTALVLAPLGWLVLNVPEGAAARTLKSDDQSASDAADAQTSKFGALGSPSFWLILVATLCPMLPLSAMPPQFVSVAIESGQDVVKGGYLILAFSVTAALGNLLFGWLIDRLDHRIAYLGISAATIVSMLLFATKPGMPGLLTAAIALGLAGGGVMPWSASMVTRTFGAVAFARTFGLLNLFFLPATLFAVVVGWLYDQTGAYTLAFIGFAALCLPGLIGLGFLKPGPRPTMPTRVAHI